MRWLAALLVLTALTAACSSKSASSATATTAPPPAVTTTTTLPANDGLTALGATWAEWDAKHTPDPSKVSVKGRPTAYLPAVNGSGDEYSSVIQANGRVSAYHITFPTPLSLTAAESFLAAQLPSDATVTDSRQASTTKSSSTCEVLDYQSAMLGHILGPAPFDDPTGVVGAILETTNADGSTTVNTAGITDGGIGLTANGPTTTC